MISWYALWVKDAIRGMWRDLPGPWPVKIALIVGCQFIPGPLDEIALVAIARTWRQWRNRKEQANVA